MRVAVIGAGPSGAALAILLARQGARVTLFDDGRRPELLVGESLVPAVVPILQRLGLEEETASFSRVKPGVSFIWSPNDRFSFSFARFAPGVFPYAYNIPRPQFDDAVLARAVASGVERVVSHARLEPISEEGRELGLAPETLAAAPSLGGRQPDLVVDPMLSPGVLLALRSAELVADALAPFAKAQQAPSLAELEAALRPYATTQTAMLTAWLDLVATFYDGRMAALFRAGRDWMAVGTNAIKNAAQNHIERHIALQASGMGTLGRYNRGLLRFMGRYGLRGVEPTEMAIR